MNTKEIRSQIEIGVRTAQAAQRAWPEDDCPDYRFWTPYEGVPAPIQPEEVITLIDALAASQERERALREALAQVQWGYPYTEETLGCTICYQTKDEGHDADCIIGRALAETPGPRIAPRP